MNKSALEREYQRVYGSYVWQDYPVHASGAALMIVNESSILNAVISLDESVNGTTWTPILFSTHSTAGNLNITLVPQAYNTFLFTSCREFVRITTTPDNADGVYVHMVQWPPTKVVCVDEVYAAGS